MMRWALAVVGITAGLALIGVGLLAFDRLMLWSEQRRSEARRLREETGESHGLTSTGAFGVGFEIWQPGYRAFVDEKQRQENWIEQAESGAPPRDVDLDRGMAVIRLPKQPPNTDPNTDPNAAPPTGEG
jgi:hypothetical protein